MNTKKSIVVIPNTSVKIELPKEVEFIISELQKNNHRAYVVGGCVRDSLLHKTPKDWDITTSAMPDEVVSLFKKQYDVIPTGIKHGTVTVMINHVGYEITTFRTDGVYEDGRHPSSVNFTPSLVEDLSRRDFTINAMAYNSNVGLIDVYNGLNDIKNKLIVTVGNADDRFNEDALRMLRCIRFSAQLGFTIEPKVFNTIVCLDYKLQNISKERIQSELNKILLSDSNKIKHLVKSGLMKYIIEEVSSMMNFNQNNPYHSYDLLNHTLMATTIVPNMLHLKLTMLLHDIGKLTTGHMDDNGISHYYNHATESAKLAKNILSSLKYDNATSDKVITLIGIHDYVFADKENTIRKQLKSLLNKYGENIVKDLIIVRQADVIAQNPKFIYERLQKINKVSAILDNILDNEECFSIKQLEITGKDLINLGMKQGKGIGELLTILLGNVINRNIPNEHSALVEFAKKHYINAYRLQ